MSYALRNLVTATSVATLLAMSAGAVTPIQAQTLSQEAYFAGQHKFAHGLLQQALQDSKPNSNVFLSPLSANLALSMLLDGARGSTKDAMLDGLGLPADTDVTALHAQNAAYLTDISSASEGLTISINNALWADKRFPLQDEFTAHLTDYYDAKVANADFQFEAPLVADNINQWAAESTNHKITKVIDAKTVRGLSVLLANATYFKGIWHEPFNKNYTRDMTFTSEAGATKVPMMHKEVGARYLSEDYQAISLPYEGEKASMYVILPPAGSAGRAWTTEHVLKEGFWDKLDANMVRRKVQLSLPKFKVEKSALLNDNLTAMGFGSIFASPDFSGLSPVGAQVSYVKQDTFVQVDEEGTEAAAVTTIGIRATSVGPRLQTVMRVDRPFFVAIRDNTSKAFLFMGYIANPSF